MAKANQKKKSRIMCSWFTPLFFIWYKHFANVSIFPGDWEFSNIFFVRGCEKDSDAIKDAIQTFCALHINTHSGSHFYGYQLICCVFAHVRASRVL